MAQTDGTPLPEPTEAGGDPGATTDRLKAAIASHGVAMDYVQELDGALGTSSGGRIQVLTGLQPASEFMVLAHEFAHELLHHGDDRPGSRDTRELEAEAVAFVVGHAIGLDVTDAARDYIHLYRGDGAALAESLGRIQRTAAAVLAAIGADDTDAGRESYTRPLDPLKKQMAGSPSDRPFVPSVSRAYASRPASRGPPPHAVSGE